MSAATELIARHRETARDYIAAERGFIANGGNARAKARLDHVREIITGLAPVLWQHQPEAKSDQIVWAEYVVKGAVVFLVCRDNVAMFREARHRAQAILGD